MKLAQLQEARYQDDPYTDWVRQTILKQDRFADEMDDGQIAINWQETTHQVIVVPVEDHEQLIKQLTSAFGEPEHVKGAYTWLVDSPKYDWTWPVLYLYSQDTSTPRYLLIDDVLYPEDR